MNTEHSIPQQPAGVQIPAKPEGFWQNMIAERDNIERRKANANLREQVGQRQSIAFGGIGASISYAWHSFTKYPKMLFAGMFGAGEPVKIVVPEMNQALKNTELAQDMQKLSELKSQSITHETQALHSIVSNPNKGFFGKLNEYASYRSVARHEKYKGSYVVENEESTLSTLAHIGVVAGGLALKMGVFDAQSAEAGDLKSPSVPANANPAPAADRSPI